MVKDNAKQLLDRRKLAMEILDRSLSLQFGRLNFFLAGTAFLIMAFATVVTVSKGNYQLHILAHAINAVGCYLALFFALTNYLNAKLFAKMQEDIFKEGPESPFVKQEPYAWLNNILHSEWKLEALWPSLEDFVKNPIRYGKDYPSAHTWLIPVLFAIFWLITWFAVIRQYWVAADFGFGLPLFVLWYLLQRESETKKSKLLWLGFMAITLIAMVTGPAIAI